jgi:hypothetical protein
LGIVWNYLILIISKLIYKCGNCLGIVWELFGNCLGIVWELFGNFRGRKEGEEKKIKKKCKNVF